MPPKDGRSRDSPLSRPRERLRRRHLSAANDFKASRGTKPMVKVVEGQLRVKGRVLGNVTMTCRVLSDTYAHNFSVVEGIIDPETMSEDALAKRIKDMAWCLVLGSRTYATLPDQIAEDKLLDDSCSYLFNALIRAARDDAMSMLAGNEPADQESRRRLLQLVRLACKARLSDSPVEGNVQTSSEFEDWLRSVINGYWDMQEESQETDDLAQTLTGLFNPNANQRFTISCEVRGALGVKQRPLFILDHGQGIMGAGPPQLETGDLICVLYGGETPYVLRRTSNTAFEEYSLVGDCYLHGHMQGEALDSEKFGEDTCFQIV